LKDSPTESIFLYGEGKMDAVFLNHLKELYGNPAKQLVTVDRAQGGSPDCIVNRMITTGLQIANYDRCLLLIDSDIPIENKSLQKIKENEIELVLSRPGCIEGLMLYILNDLPNNAASATSTTLKKHFWRHISATNNTRAIRILSETVGDLFPKTVLESARETCPELDRILAFIES
jgi:hypothetical protein